MSNPNIKVETSRPVAIARPGSPTTVSLRNSGGIKVPSSPTNYKTPGSPQINFDRRSSIVDASQIVSRKWASKPVQTKIVCTMGPATESVEVLEKMIAAGMDIVRLNFSHGSAEYHTATFNKIRALSEQYDNQLSIMADIQGPKIRTGKMEAPFEVQEGDICRVTPEKIVGNKDRFTITYETLLKDLVKGDVIYVNDGVVRMSVIGSEPNNLICRVEAPGEISDRKGCNMPTANLSADLPTAKDREDLKLIAKLNPEWVAASFVGDAKDVNDIRKALADAGNTDIKVIAKIERPIALKNLDEIIAASDAVMVARGDLGVEIAPWDVPFAQKDMIARCNKAGKPVILATQILESMIHNSRPTRAEASDVYNGVLDGADAVMLSAETSVGKFPVEAVTYMDTIADKAAQNMPVKNYEPYFATVTRPSTTTVIGHAVTTISTEFFELEKKLTSHTSRIVVITRSGRVARMIAKYRPKHPIIAITPLKRTALELNLTWGVRSLFVENLEGKYFEQRIAMGIKSAVEANLVDVNDQVIAVCASMLQNVEKDTGLVMGVYKVKEVLASLEEGTPGTSPIIPHK